jgi:GTP-binding protein
MIKKAEFLTSVGNFAQYNGGCKNQIAVIGRSNVGKSSFINFICRRTRLAKIGKEPGKTRLLNFYKINDGEFYFVDLPGYGFARVSAEEKNKWASLIEEYLQKADELKHAFVLVDIRREPTEDDKQMLKYLYFYNIPFTVIATKSDKVSRREIAVRQKKIADALCVGVGNVYVCSSFEGSGAEEIYARLKSILDA